MGISHPHLSETWLLIFPCALILISKGSSFGAHGKITVGHLILKIVSSLLVSASFPLGGVCKPIEFDDQLSCFGLIEPPPFLGPTQEYQKLYIQFCSVTVFKQQAMGQFIIQQMAILQCFSSH